MSKFRQIVENIVNNSVNNILLEAKTLKLDIPKNWNNNVPYNHFIILVNPNANEIYNFWKNSKYHDIRAIQREDTGDYYWADAYYLTHPELIDILYLNGYIPEDMHEELVSMYDGIEITQDRSVDSSLLQDIPGLDKYFYIGTFDPETYNPVSNNKFGFSGDENALFNLAHNTKELENPEDIKNIENPSEDMQLQVVAERPDLFQYIKNPTDKVKALYNTLTAEEL